MYSRFSLEGVEQFTELLRRTTDRIRQLGFTHATLALASDPGLHQFTLDAANFTVEDYGAHGGPHCQVCDTRRDRRFAFYLRCQDGEVRGPIGTSCVFQHVLGEAEGRKLGRSLHRIMLDAAYLQGQLARLREAGNYYAYIEGLGLAWIFDHAEYRRVTLTPGEYRTVGACRSQTRPFPKALLEKLQRHQLRESEPLQVPPRPAQLPAPPPVPVAPPIALSAAERGRVFACWDLGLSASLVREHQQQISGLLSEFRPLPAALHGTLMRALLEVERTLRDEARRQAEQREEEEKTRTEELEAQLAAQLGSAWGSHRGGGPRPQALVLGRDVTATDVLAAACAFLNRRQADDLRRALTRRHSAWVVETFPGEVQHYLRTGQFPKRLYRKLREALTPTAPPLN